MTATAEIIVLGEEQEDALEEQQNQLLAAFATELVGLRREAIGARISSGIENIWKYCDDAFNGVDEVSRGFSYKPMSPDGPFLSSFSSQKDSEWKRSRAFYNITAPYVLMAARRPHEILFPTEMRNWELRKTPRTDLDALLVWITEKVSAAPEELQYVSGLVNGMSLQRDEQVDDAQRQIDDWMKESPEPFVDVAEQVFEDSARMGTGVVKGPIPMISRGGAAQPGVIRISAWNLYPSANCGENIHNGDHIFEREEISSRLLREKMREGMEMGWLPEQIEEMLEEGPKSYTTGTAVSGKIHELWHFQGEVSLELLRVCGCNVDDLKGKKAWANVTLGNDKIIRVGRAPLQHRFTYYAIPWRRRKGYWAGIGVAEDLEDIQRGVNAQIRNLQDNSALSAVPQIVHWKGLIEPVNGKFRIEPGKEWRVNSDQGDALLQFVKNAIFTIEIPCRLDELRKNIDMFLSLAEQVTGISNVVRGLTQPESVGGGQMQMNASGQAARRVARNWDSFVLRPLIQAFVQWIRDFSVLPLEEVTVAVYGSTVLVERDLQAQAVMAAVQLAANPIYGHDPEKMMDQWLLSNKFDPAKTRMGPERRAQLEQMVQAMQQKQEDGAPQVQSATIRAQALTHQAELEAQSDAMRTAGELEDSARSRAHQKEMRILDAKMELMKYAAQKGIDLQAAQQELQTLKIPYDALSRELDTAAEIEKLKAKPASVPAPKGKK